jgi:hypothetical protein
VISDDLNAPLGQDRRERSRKLPTAAPQIVAAVLGLFGIAILVWAIFVNDPLGGEPEALVATGSLAKVPAKPATVDYGQQNSRHDGSSSDKAPSVKVVTPAAVAPLPGSKTITIIDGSSGKRQDVVIPGSSNDGAQKESANQPVESTR